MKILGFTEKGFSLNEEYIQYCYTQLIKNEGIREDFTIENFFDLAASNYKVIDNLLSFIDYLNNGMESYISEDLNDIMDVFNNHKGTKEIGHLFYEYNEGDIDYLKTLIKDKFSRYDPYVYDEHIKYVLSENYKLLNEVKNKSVNENQYYKDTLIASLQVALVGAQEPAPCAKQYVKNSYYALFKDLKRRY